VKVAYAAQLAGIVAVAVGFGLLAIWAGVVVGGVELLAWGVASEVGASIVGHEAVREVREPD
jgi:hypothetical protein